MTHCFTAGMRVSLLGECCPCTLSFISLNRWKSEGANCGLCGHQNGIILVNLVPQSWLQKWGSITYPEGVFHSFEVMSFIQLDLPLFLAQNACSCEWLRCPYPMLISLTFCFYSSHRESQKNRVLIWKLSSSIHSRPPLYYDKCDRTTFCFRTVKSSTWEISFYYE